MDRLKILLTGCGSPGVKGTLFSLRNNYDNRDIEIIGTDANSDAVGRYYCENFYTISSASKEKKYLSDIKSIVKKEKINIILPQNTMELLILAKNKLFFEKLNTTVIVSDSLQLNIANDKSKIMRYCKDIKIPTAKFYNVETIKELKSSAKKLGWPEKKIVIKPPVSNGSRGVRIINENIDIKSMFFNDKPNSLFTNMQILELTLGEKFETLIVSEFHEGDEYTVDVFSYNSLTTCIPRKRINIKSGITFDGVLEKNKDIIEYSTKLSEALDLKYCFGFQFILSKHQKPFLIECNPRVQGTMIMSTFAGANLIYSSVKAALGEDIPEFNINWKTRFSRYWGGISISDDKIFELL